MRRRVRRGAGVLAVITALALALTGCVPFGALPDAPAHTSSPAPVPSGLDPALARFYTQRLAWTSCADGMYCAKATAPLDWSHPGAGSIELALIRHPATGTSRGSLLVNPGGPGASGFDFVRDSLDYAVDSTLTKHYDIVGFDPRGVGRSSAVRCYDAAGMTHYLYDIVPGARGSDTWIAGSEAKATAFGAACQEKTGALLAHVDTVSAARDLDLMRAVLGDARLDYLGYSYGTLLGATYAELYPSRVGRMVLDGALDPSIGQDEVTRVQAEGFEGSLRDYVAACEKGKDCPLSGSVDDGMRRIASLLASVDRSPLKDEDGRMLGADALFTAIIYPLYDPTLWPTLTTMLADVIAGDPSSAFALADQYNDRRPDGTYSSNVTEAFVAVNCLDYTYDADPATMRRQERSLEQSAPTLGEYMAFGAIGCAEWPVKGTGSAGPIHAQGSGPILVVGTTHDPATPYVWAKSLASQLADGHLVTYHGEGHTAYNKSNSCVNDTVDDYFVKGTVPRTDPDC